MLTLETQSGEIFRKLEKDAADKDDWKETRGTILFLENRIECKLS